MATALLQDMKHVENSWTFQRENHGKIDQEISGTNGSYIVFTLYPTYFLYSDRLMLNNDNGKYNDKYGRSCRTTAVGV